MGLEWIRIQDMRDDGKEELREKNEKNWGEEKVGQEWDINIKILPMFNIVNYVIWNQISNN